MDVCGELRASRPCVVMRCEMDWCGRGMRESRRGMLDGRKMRGRCSVRTKFRDWVAVGIDSLKHAPRNAVTTFCRNMLLNSISTEFPYESEPKCPHGRRAPGVVNTGCRPSPPGAYILSPPPSDRGVPCSSLSDMFVERDPEGNRLYAILLANA